MLPDSVDTVANDYSPYDRQNQPDTSPKADPLYHRWTHQISLGQASVDSGECAANGYRLLLAF